MIEVRYGSVTVTIRPDEDTRLIVDGKTVRRIVSYVESDLNMAVEAVRAAVQKAQS